MQMQGMQNSIKTIGGNLMLLLTTFFWGITFIVVKDAVAQVDVFLFLCQRFSLAFLLLLLPFPLLRQRLTLKTVRCGIMLGLWLFGVFAFQTVALVYTSASNTAFLTGLNVVLVPLLSALIYRQYIAHNARVGVMLAFSGLYLLCTNGNLALNMGDMLGVICAICVAVHIMLTARYVQSCNIYWLTTLQIGTIGLLSGLIALFSGEQIFIWYPQIRNALLICVLFATVFAYVTQTTMQRYISPTNTALIFCMEPVFAALAAYIVIDERLTLRGYLGAGMILSGMLLAELSPGFFKNSRRRLRFSIPVQNLTARSKPEA